jgi:hypothetical protein
MRWSLAVLSVVFFAAQPGEPSPLSLEKRSQCEERRPALFRLNSNQVLAAGEGNRVGAFVGGEEGQW